MDNGLRLCMFMQLKYVCLGFKIKKNKKLKAVTFLLQEKSFLGFLNYYHRHYHRQSFSDVLELLHYLLRKCVKWEWTDKQKIAFEKAKNILDKTKLVVCYDPGTPLILACDGSPNGWVQFCLIKYQIVVKNHLPLELFQRLKGIIHKFREKL